jgi:hypothetical protein
MPLFDDASLKPILTPLVELRERYERRMDSDYQPDRVDNKSLLLSRYRVGVQTKDGKLTSRFQYQYSHQWGWTPSLNSSIERSDLMEANFAFDLGSSKLTIGRQRLGFGNRRLIGELEWHNVANAFDGIRFEQGKATWFATLGGVLPNPSKNLKLVGVSLKSGNSDTLLVYKADDPKGVSQGRFTLSREGRQKSKSGNNFDYQLALQGGHEDGKRVSAWVTNLRVSKPLAKRTEGYIETNIASGGGSSSTNSTFDQLYPTGHDKLGLLDTTGWKNVAQFAVGTKTTLSPTTALKLQYSWLQLFDESDAWYGVLGGANSFGATTYRDPSGNSGRSLGQEFDVDYSTSLSKSIRLNAGGGFFMPGSFVKSFGGPNFGSQVFGYVMVGYKF